MNTNAPAANLKRADLVWPEPMRRRAVAGALVALLIILWLNAFGGLFGALAGYSLTSLVRRPRVNDAPRWRRIANALLAFALVAGGAFALIEGFHLLLNASTDGLPRLMQLIADTLDQVRGSAPTWIVANLPDSADELQRSISGWLRFHAHDMQHLGREALRLIAHLVLGLIIGVAAYVSIHRRPATAPLSALAIARWRQLAHAFTDVFAAQLRIALVNALLTAVFLLIALPAFGVHVPLAMTLVGFTFFASLLPIVGNLMANSAIILAGLTVSLWVGVASLVFLIAIHKLEYFLTRIRRFARRHAGVHPAREHAAARSGIRRVGPRRGAHLLRLAHP